MKKIIVFALLIICGNILSAQNKEEVNKLISEGVVFHDKGEYNSAIEKYNEALNIDKDNVTALGEKALSLLALQKFDESISYCKKAIKSHPKDEGLMTVYVTYGNALDATGKTDKSIKIYDEGIKLFPNYYQLHFNKGIALSGEKKYDEALLSLQNSIMINPVHAGSHNAIARILYSQKNNIPSLLAFCRFLIIESKANRAADNFQIVQKIMKGNATQTGEKSVTITLNSDLFGDSKSKGKKENNFSSAELVLSMSSALDYDEKNKNKSEVDQFIRKFESICSVLNEGKTTNNGFYWKYYVPYFTEMKNKNFMETFVYIVFAPSGDPKVADWLNTHKEEINNFYDWSGLFKWKAD